MADAVPFAPSLSTRFTREESRLSSFRLNMPLMRAVIVGFFGGGGFNKASPWPLACAGVALLEGGGSAKWPSGWEWMEEFVDADGTGEAPGFAEPVGGVEEVAAMLVVVEKAWVGLLEDGVEWEDRVSKEWSGETSVSRGLGRSPGVLLNSQQNSSRSSAGCE